MNQVEKNILTQEHPLWDDFIGELKKMGNCNHTFDTTVGILASRFPEIDIFPTLTFFKENGGACDCKILSTLFDKS